MTEKSVHFKLEESMHKQLKQRALNEGKSMKDVITDALQQAYGDTILKETVVSVISPPSVPFITEVKKETYKNTKSKK